MNERSLQIAILSHDSELNTILINTLHQNSPHRVSWVSDSIKSTLRHAAGHRPDILLLVVSGESQQPLCEQVKQLLSHQLRSILLITTCMTRKSAAVLEALGAGALDAFNITCDTSKYKIETRELLRKIQYLQRLQKHPLPPPRVSTAPVPTLTDCLVVIGCSTGGPAALAQLLPLLPADFPAATLIAQHIDVAFVDNLVNWLNTQSALDVTVATPGERPAPGKVLVAATHDHLLLRADGALDYTADPRNLFYRPSVDILFNSVAKNWPGRIIGILLTGMGQDGAAGLLQIRQRSMLTIAQDQDSCVVFGMPKAAIQLGAAEKILNIEQIGELLLTSVRSPLQTISQKK